MRIDRFLLADPIYFEPGKAAIKEQSRRILKELARRRTPTPEIERVDIQVHTDERGDDTFNLRLSDERAQAVQRAARVAGRRRSAPVGARPGRDEAALPRAQRAVPATNRRVEMWITAAGGVTAISTSSSTREPAISAPIAVVGHDLLGEADGGEGVGVELHQACGGSR